MANDWPTLQLSIRFEKPYEHFFSRKSKNSDYPKLQVALVVKNTTYRTEQVYVVPVRLSQLNPL